MATVDRWCWPGRMRRNSPSAFDSGWSVVRATTPDWLLWTWDAKSQLVRSQRAGSTERFEIEEGSDSWRALKWRESEEPVRPMANDLSWRLWQDKSLAIGRTGSSDTLHFN